MRIAVAGGTGAVGRHVVDVVRDRGHEPLVLARSAGIDLTRGAELGLVLEGVAVVIDVASVQTTSARAARRFFGTTTANLLRAEADAGVRHHLALSIVNVDRVAAGYYAGKVAQERLVEGGTVPWTILRATQFHDFAAQMLERGTVGPFALVPRMRTQPVAPREVAERLVDLALGAPAGHVADLAGPREERLVDMVRAYARAMHVRGRVLEVSLPGGMWTAMRDGSLLPGPDAACGSQTFADWLERARGTLPLP